MFPNVLTRRLTQQSLPTTQAHDAVFVVVLDIEKGVVTHFAARRRCLALYCRYHNRDVHP